MNTTTVVIPKELYNKTAKWAKKDYMSVSAVVRKLLDAYVERQINITVVNNNNLIDFQELPKEETSPELRKKADEVYNMDEEHFINI